MSRSKKMRNSLAAGPPRRRDFPATRFWASWFALGFVRLLATLPKWIRAQLGAVTGTMTRLLYRSRTIPTNLGLCFPELDAHTRTTLTRRYFRAVGAVVIDLGVAWGRSPERIKRLVRIRGADHVERARAAGRAVILLAPHFVALEIGWARLALEWPAICMYRRPRNPLLHQAILHFRTRHGAMAVERYANLKPLVRELRAGRVFYYLPDQDPDRRTDKYVFAPFFSVPTATYTTLGRLAEMTGAAVIPCVTRWLGFAEGYEISLMAPLENFPTGDEVSDAGRMNAAIEQIVRATPEQYFWAYRRFKTRPDGARSPYRR